MRYRPGGQSSSRAALAALLLDKVIYEGPDLALECSAPDLLPIFKRNGPLVASHLIDFEFGGIFLSVARATRTMASASITDAQTGPGTPPLVPLTGTVISDVESSGALTRIDASWVSDIEHVHVNDDPRAWSPKLKVSSVCSALCYRSHHPIAR